MSEQRDESTIDVHQPTDAERAEAEASAPDGDAPAPSSRNDPNAPDRPKT